MTIYLALHLTVALCLRESFPYSFGPWEWLSDLVCLCWPVIVLDVLFNKSVAHD